MHVGRPNGPIQPSSGRILVSRVASSLDETPRMLAIISAAWRHGVLFGVVAEMHAAAAGDVVEVDV